jgi:hypothetical protein
MSPPDEHYDIVLDCPDCSQQFVWSAGEQKFYAQRGFAKPRRCARCREVKRADRDGVKAAKAASRG